MKLSPHNEPICSHTFALLTVDDHEKHDNVKRMFMKGAPAWHASSTEFQYLFLSVVIDDLALDLGRALGGLQQCACQLRLFIAGARTLFLDAMPRGTKKSVLYHNPFSQEHREPVAFFSWAHPWSRMPYNPAREHTTV